MTQDFEPGDWGGENLPLVIREHIDVADRAIAELRALLVGYFAGAARVAAQVEAVERAE